jgi:CBS domain containing-hemolysin-like protein
MLTPIMVFLLTTLLVLASTSFLAPQFAIVKIRPTRVRELAATGGRCAWLPLGDCLHIGCVSGEET